MNAKPHFKFPKHFLWGAATSAHQVEGGQSNNWTDWEKEHAVELARGSKKAFDSPSVHWYRIKKQALDPTNYISGLAADHYHRYEEDFDHARRLGHNAHRFSIEWSRIEPQRGVVDQAALTHYKRVVKALRKRGLEPIVTLFHFTLPTWVAAQGGFTNRQTIADFLHFSQIVVEALGDDVRYWCTINEPEVFASFSYTFGYWPPQHKSYLQGVRAYLSILPQAHIAVYKMIKHRHPSAQVGVSKDQGWYVGQSLFTRAVMRPLWNWWANYSFLDKIKGHQDYIGVNYYFRFNLHGWRVEIDQQNPSDMGWGLSPEGLYEVVKATGRRYQKPIIVTECGVADAQDETRAWYIKAVLRELHKAMTEGVVVHGFLYWALLDNFEWDKGFWPRFGLIEISPKTLKRTVRPSALEYAKVIKAGGLD